MSKRIAVAITATIGVTLLLANVAQARPELVGVHNGEYAPGTIVVKTNERHLLPHTRPGPRDALPGRCRQIWQAVGRRDPH